MPRSGAGFQFGIAAGIRRQCPFFGVKVIRQHQIQSEVRCEGKTICRIDIDAVRVWGFLSPRIDAFPLVLHEGCRLSEFSVGFQGVHANTPPTIIR